MEQYTSFFIYYDERGSKDSSRAVMLKQKLYPIWFSTEMCFAALKWMNKNFSSTKEDNLLFYIVLGDVP